MLALGTVRGLCNYLFEYFLSRAVTSSVYRAETLRTAKLGRRLICWRR